MPTPVTQKIKPLRLHNADSRDGPPRVIVDVRTEPGVHRPDNKDVSDALHASTTSSGTAWDNVHDESAAAHVVHDFVTISASSASHDATNKTTM